MELTVDTQLVIPLAELVIRNARLVLPEGVVAGGLSVEGGCIAEVSRSKLPKGEQDIDAKGKLVMPGAIDSHVHFYDPNYTHREDFESGSRAAGAGGVTSVIVMPLDTPMLAPEELKEAIKIGERQSLIDFALYAGNMTGAAIEHIAADTKLGVRAFKLFTCAPYGVDEPTFVKLMRAIDEAGSTSFVHAEDNEILQAKTKELREAGRSDPLAHAESRPNKAEEKAVEWVLKQTREVGCRLHLAHITTRQGAELVKRAKNEKLKVTAETCPHYLLFTKDDMDEKGPYLKVNPALKTEADKAALWEALAEGTIDIIATDHAPGTREEKEVGWDNIWDAQIGAPGVETLLPLMMSEGVVRGRLPIERLVDALCARPAKTFGFYPQKGAIRVGSDADLVIIDMEKRAKIEAEKLHYKVGWTPYEGMEVKGWPVMTISRGEIIAKDGDILGKPGHGRYIKR